MASFLRGRQAGIQRDLSEGILPELFAPDDLARYGINSQIGCIAYEPVQALLAIGTNESSFGSGQIYIFGQRRVQVTLQLPRRASVKVLQFCADRVISLDSNNELLLWDLATAKNVGSAIPPGVVTSLVTDPMLDWALIGLQNGTVVAYDLDRVRFARLRIPNFWHERSQKSRILPIVSMQLHPRDIGQLLIGYPEGAVIYSFKQNTAIKHFEYIVPVGAPGGHRDPTAMQKVRKPSLRHVLWHPTGSFVGIAYDDSTLVFWDPKDGRIVMSRTLTDVYVDRPISQDREDAFAPKELFNKIAWCCKDNPDDTGLLLAGGVLKNLPSKGLTFLELGVAPVYATSSWQLLTNHFKGKWQQLLPTPEGADVVDFCVIPRSSPHYAGYQDPIAIIALLTSGELVTLSFPIGHPISPTNQLHPSISFVHPFVISMNIALLDRGRWLGMTEDRQQGPLLLKGGAEGSKPMKRFEGRNILLMAHGDGTVRIWDAGQADQLENSAMLQVDIARALERSDDINIRILSMSETTAELAVGTSTGEVTVHRWGRNKLCGRESPQSVETVSGGLTDITSRAEPTLKEGMQPFVLYSMSQGPITALKMSEVGFVGVGAESGIFSIIDLRGPAVIFSCVLSELVKSDKRSSFLRRKGSTTTKQQDWPVVIEFGVMTLEGDNYSSIACFVGTYLGKVVTFKIKPAGNNGYTAQFAGITSLADKILSIIPIVPDSGKTAQATGETVAALRSGQQTHGILVTVSLSEVRIFKPAMAKGAHKSFDNYLCYSAQVTAFEDRGHVLVGVFGDCITRAFSLPGLKELAAFSLPQLDPTRLTSSLITYSGTIFGWTGPSEVAMLSIWGTAQPLLKSTDRLYNPEALTPPRPTISNLEWISGTQYVSPIDLDLLIRGPDRPPSRRMTAAVAEEQSERGNSSTSRPPPGTQSNEGWGEYMARQLNERTEKLNLVGDSMDKVQENSQGWADDVHKFVGKQKRNMVFGAITRKWL